MSACLRAGQSLSSDKPAVSEKRNARRVLSDELFLLVLFLLAVQKEKNITGQKAKSL